MPADHETVRLLERLHVRAWPASDTASIDGWLWRFSGGGSWRANSVSAIDFTGTDAAASLDQVEAMYRANAAFVRVQTFDLTRPPELPALLAARGYQASEATLTMLAIASPAAFPADVEVTDVATQEWREVYLDAITGDRRTLAEQMFRRIPDPRAFFVVRRNGRVISTALGVAHGAYAVAECVATRPDMRGQRAAESALRALMLWAGSLGAHNVGLQVVAVNDPAIRLYRRLGFETVAENRYWVRR